MYDFIQEQAWWMMDVAKVVFSNGNSFLFFSLYMNNILCWSVNDQQMR